MTGQAPGDVVVIQRMGGGAVNQGGVMDGRLEAVALNRRLLRALCGFCPVRADLTCILFCARQCDAHAIGHAHLRFGTGLF